MKMTAQASLALASCTQPRHSLPPVESLPNPPMAAQPGVTPGSSCDSRTRRYNTQSSAVPRTAVAGNCLLLPLCESQQRFVDRGAFCYCNQQLREERGGVGGGGMMIEEEVKVGVVGEMATLWERRSADSSGMR